MIWQKLASGFLKAFIGCGLGLAACAELALALSPESAWILAETNSQSSSSSSPWLLSETNVAHSSSSSPHSSSRQLERAWNLVSLPLLQSTSAGAWVSAYPAIRSLWEWTPQGAWRRYPPAAGYETLTLLQPHVGYWIEASAEFELAGTNSPPSTYALGQGWNLIGYAWGASATTPESFLSAGDFWKEACGSGTPWLSLWAWQNQHWHAYLPNQGLDALNATYQMGVLPLETLVPGSGLWLQTARSNDPATCNVTQPTLKLSALGGQTYQISLLSPSDYQSLELIGVGNVGIVCPGFAQLQGAQTYQPTSSGLGDNRSISLIDLSSQRQIAKASLELYRFTCTSKPTFRLGETVAITYGGLNPLTGPTQIQAQDLP